MRTCNVVHTRDEHGVFAAASCVERCGEPKAVLTLQVEDSGRALGHIATTTYAQREWRANADRRSETQIGPLGLGRRSSAQPAE